MFQIRNVVNTSNNRMITLHYTRIAKNEKWLVSKKKKKKKKRNHELTDKT